MYQLAVFEVILTEFERALAATRRYESLRCARHGHFAPADIAERIFEEFYARPASSAARPWKRPRRLLEAAFQQRLDIGQPTKR
jgi:hypothetical protein